MQRLLLVILLLATACGDVEAFPIKRPATNGGTEPIGAAMAAAIDAWEFNMTEYGDNYCLDTNTDETRVWYYDGLYVYQKIRDYTGDSATWQPCVNNMETVYKGMIDEVGQLQGRRAFAHGIELLGSGSYSYLGDLVDNVSYSNLFHNCSDPDSAHHELVASREVAYLLRNLLIAESHGESSPWTIDDIDPSDQCTNLGNNHALTSADALQFVKWHANEFINNSTYVQSFMAGLTASALIEYDEMIGGDAAVPLLVKGLADWLWANAWIDGPDRFRYCTNRSDNSLCLDPDDDKYSVDLNQLIAPMYAWLYKEGYGVAYAQHYDEIFIAATILDDGGTVPVEGVGLGYQGKAFSQNYKESFRSLAWRQAGPP